MSSQENNKVVGAAAMIAAGAVVGGLCGYAAGILFAKKPGKETRQEIAEGIQQATQRVRAQYQPDDILQQMISIDSINE